MLPLLLKDGLLAPYAVTSLAFLFLGLYLLSALERCSEEELRLAAYRKIFFWLPQLDMARVVRWKFCTSVAVMAGLSVASAALVPPPQLPDLFPVLVSSVAFLHFFGTLVYFNVVQLSGAPRRKGQKKRD